jgi:hypothetical protein
MIFLSHPQTFCGFETVETVQNPTVDLATVRHSKRDTVVSRGGGGGGGESLLFLLLLLLLLLQNPQSGSRYCYCTT